jgi:hypothetical protein
MMAVLLAIMMDYRLVSPDYRLCVPAAPPAVVGHKDQSEGPQCAGGQCAVPRTLPSVRWRLFRGRAR